MKNPIGKKHKNKPESRHVMLKNPTQKSITVFGGKRKGNETTSFISAGKIDKIQAQKSWRAKFFLLLHSNNI